MIVVLIGFLWVLVVLICWLIIGMLAVVAWGGILMFVLVEYDSCLSVIVDSVGIELVDVMILLLWMKIVNVLDWCVIVVCVVLVRLDDDFCSVRLRVVLFNVR